MPVPLTAKIEPLNAGFTGMVDADQVLGDGATNVLPDACVAESNVTQHEAALSPANMLATGITDGYVLTADGANGIAWEAAAGGASALNDLSDVTIGSPTNGQVLKYNSGTGQWNNGTNTVTMNFDDLADAPAYPVGSTGNMLYNSASGGPLAFSTGKMNASGTMTDISGITVINSTDININGSGKVYYNADTTPSACIAWNNFTTGLSAGIMVKISSTAGRARQIEADAGAEIDVTNGDGVSGNIQLGIAQQSATSGQVLAWNGSKWAPSAAGTGDVSGPSSVTATGNIAVFDGTGGKTIQDGLLTINQVLTSAASTSVQKSLFDAHTIIAAVADDTPAAVTVAEQTLVGRITGGNIDDLSTTQVRTLLNVEDGADVTDATNVAAAGAVMDGDFGTNGYCVRTASGTYANRSFTAGAGMTISNTDGVSAGSEFSVKAAVYTQCKAMYLENPVAGDIYMMQCFPSAGTITEVKGYTDASSATVTYDIDKRTDPSGAGTNTTICSDDVAVYGGATATIDVSSVSAGDWLFFEVKSVSSSPAPTGWWVSVTYTPTVT